MIRPSLLRLAGMLLLAASFFVFAYGLASVFYGHIAVTCILAVIFGLMLHFGLCLMDNDDEKGDISTDSHKEDFVSAVVLISHYADKYHDKDAEYAKEHIEALKEISNNEGYHIQRASECEKRRIEEEMMVISLAEEIRKKHLGIS